MKETAIMHWGSHSGQRVACGKVSGHREAKGSKEASANGMEWNGQWRERRRRIPEGVVGEHPIGLVSSGEYNWVSL